MHATSAAIAAIHARLAQLLRKSSRRPPHSRRSGDSNWSCGAVKEIGVLRLDTPRRRRRSRLHCHRQAASDRGRSQWTRRPAGPSPSACSRIAFCRPSVERRFPPALCHSTRPGARRRHGADGYRGALQGGYKVKGRCATGSGSLHADWLLRCVWFERIARRSPVRSLAVRSRGW